MTGRAAIVTGAARGIGFAAAKRLAESGAAVTLVDISPQVIDSAKNLRDLGLTASGIVGDVSSSAAVERIVGEARDEFGSQAILVNNAALTQVHRDWKSVTPEQWDEVIRTNLTSMFLCVRTVIDDMEAGEWGRIVNISSVTFLRGQRRLIDYVSSKGGVVGFTRALAREVGALGITANVVTPGAIRTEMEVELFGDADDAELLAVQSIPRRGTADDVAAAVQFLCSDDAGFVTGQNLVVDGGWVMN